MAKIIVRQYMPGDEKGLAGLDRQAARECGCWDRHSLNDFRELGKHKGMIWIVEAEGKMAGFLTGNVMKMDTLCGYRRDVLELDDLFVLKGFRKMGIASRLVKAFLSECRKRKEKEIACIAADKCLAGFYKKFGFRQVYYLERKNR